MTKQGHQRLAVKAYRLSVENGGYCPSEEENPETAIYEGQSSEEILESLFALVL